MSIWHDIRDEIGTLFDDVEAVERRAEEADTIEAERLAATLSEAVMSQAWDTLSWIYDVAVAKTKEDK